MGWTLIGWIVALLWAINSKPETKSYNYVCSHCGYKTSLDQKVTIYVCPQCNQKTEIPVSMPIPNTSDNEVQTTDDNRSKDKKLIQKPEPQDPLVKLKETLRNDEIIVKVLRSCK